ncbi:LacI family DNA-binding transcriptional regulator [Radiobacillus deserti]|uniref:LacI family transcriptional regulator n=1 Tax=Radiobacillus deserti TaxID=2594883 RepID=A0A516KDI8_9BACI|nr:LacI family DNA-binding transcriptional regulator [Radiobacillus deserti]QDP39468.1 LacI family transcriptional regulator [Radiobacillus deserti]
MTNIKDIAKRVGVSTATVSHVLNGTGRVGEDTRKKVLHVIDELNYTPNRIAKSLKVKKTSTLGIIAEDVTVFNTPSIIDGINEVAENNGLGILLVNLRIFHKMGTDFSDKDKLRKLLAQAFEQLHMNQVDGIIYIGTYNRDVTEAIPPIQIPVVYTYCKTTNESDYTVNYDDEEAAYKATKHLIEHGHKKIALISGKVDSVHSHERFNGYCRALKENGVTLEPCLIKNGDWEVESGYYLTKELLDEKNRPTAIVALNDLMAYGSIKAAKEKGLNVPSDLSIIGFDNREFSAYTSPELTTMSIPLHLMGEKATYILHELINGKTLEERELKLYCEMINRNSVCKI